MKSVDLTKLAEGTPVVVGSAIVPVPRIEPGARIIPVVRLGELVVVSAGAFQAAADAVAEAERAVAALARCTDAQISEFYGCFAKRLSDDAVWGAIAEQNRADVASAEQRGRSTTRLRVSDKMRWAMIDGLHGWSRTASRVGEVVERRDVAGMSFERRRAPLGVVGFVFEGRPNVFADGAGVVRNRNAAVMRIGSDALGTAQAVETLALRPALQEAGLPLGALCLVRSREHGAGQALFTLPQVRLAVARGSGDTVSLLGCIAEQHGIPASLHGTGGGWMFVEQSANPQVVLHAIANSLDRKVCNTLNVLLLEQSAVAALGPVCERALRELKARVHVATGAEGVVSGEPGFDPAQLGHEWEWESTPELSFAVVDGMQSAVGMINRLSPRFVASILSSRPGAFEEFYSQVDCPYVGNGFTRWVDGQWAWDRPELGLSNWQGGRLLGRSGMLSGDDILTVRDVFFDRTGEGTQRR